MKIKEDYKKLKEFYEEKIDNIKDKEWQCWEKIYTEIDLEEKLLVMNETINYTVIMHVYNEEKTLEASLQSIYNQTEQPTEFYIVDDGSTDSTPEIIHTTGHPHKHLQPNPKTQPHIRRGTAFNHAVDGARAEYHPDYLLKVDGDTVIQPNYVEHLLTYMKNRTCAASSGKSTEYNKTRDLNNGAVLYRDCVLPYAKKTYGWDRGIQLELIRKGYTFTVDPTVFYTDLRLPTSLKPSTLRIIQNRFNRQLANLEGTLRRIIK